MGEKPLISILIRTTKNREHLLERCLHSIRMQTYFNWNLIICSDDISIAEKIGCFYVQPNLSLGAFFYNDYCNTLKSHVPGGWFFFLDDDDYLIDATALERISQHFEGNDAVVCQMQRTSGKIKPNDLLIESQLIESGRVGLPCLFLHSDHVHLADIPAVENGDFIWIDTVTRAVTTAFVKEVVVYSPQRSFGL